MANFDIGAVNEPHPGVPCSAGALPAKDRTSKATFQNKNSSRDTKSMMLRRGVSSNTNPFTCPLLKSIEVVAFPGGICREHGSFGFA